VFDYSAKKPAAVLRRSVSEREGETWLRLRWFGEGEGAKTGLFNDRGQGGGGGGVLF